MFKVQKRGSLLIRPLREVLNQNIFEEEISQTEVNQVYARQILTNDLEKSTRGQFAYQPLRQKFQNPNTFFSLW